MFTSRARLRLAAALVPLLVVALLGAGLYRSQQKGRDDLADRFTARGELAARFIASYAEELLDRERQVARQTLSGSRPQDAFRGAAAAFGVEAAVLLDADGRLLAVLPHDPALIGDEIASQYTHLARASRGEAAVSAVVPSAARGEPVVAFAVPFPTADGRRVFSAAHGIADSPLAAFLGDSSPIRGSKAFLVDQHGGLIADSTGNAGAVERFEDRDPSLAAAARHTERGRYDSHDGEHYFSRHPVPGTPWSVVMAAPTGTLFAPVQGVTRIVPWLLLGGLALLAGVAGWLAVRLVEGRRRVDDLNEALDVLARTDELTGLANRRHMAEHLDQVLAGARRHGVPVTVLLADIDHFKGLNDTYGHNAGDEAIKHVARSLEQGLRIEDVLSRWGGEEFLAVLPHTSLEDAVVVAERLRSALAGTPLVIGTGADVVSLTISIGLAQFAGEHSNVLVHRADEAMYEAKAAGRNQVCASRNPTYA